MPDRIAVIGGGIVGLSVASALTRRVGPAVVVLEAEREVAAHQTGRNSGVIHSGLYYRPGSLKALHCIEGRRALYRFCASRGIAHERCGKLVVATTPAERERLHGLEQRGRANGLEGLRRVDSAELRDYEPHVSGLAGLWVPQTGIVDFAAVARALAADLQAAGSEVRTEHRVRAVSSGPCGFELRCRGTSVTARNVINCAGLQSDRIARMCGLDPGLRIVPFRGEYHGLVPGREHLVRNLIYPVPDPRFPFLGVHFTRMARGGVEVGPNAVLALRREGYGRMSFSARDALGTLGYTGFWRLASRHWRSGVAELRRSFRRSELVRDLRRMVPELNAEDLRPAGAGVRAQAVGRDGALLDDFHLLQAPGMVHVLNAPSPAATASLSIGEHVAGVAVEAFGLR